MDHGLGAPPSPQTLTQLDHFEDTKDYREKDFFGIQVKKLAQAVATGDFISPETNRFIQDYLNPVFNLNHGLPNRTALTLPDFSFETAARATMKSHFEVKIATATAENLVSLPTVATNDSSATDDYRHLHDHLLQQTWPIYSRQQGLSSSQALNAIQAESRKTREEIATLKEKIEARYLTPSAELKASLDTDLDRLTYVTGAEGRLTWDRLIHLAGNANLARYQQQLPYLSNSECIKLYQETTTFMSLHILLHQFSRVEKALANGNIQEAGQQIYAPIHREQDDTVPSVMSVEYDREWVLRQNQWQMVSEFLNYVNTCQKDPSANGVLSHKEFMGGGKTVAYILTAMRLITPDRPVFVMTPEALIGQVRKEFKQSFNAIGRNVVTLSFETVINTTTLQDQKEALQKIANLVNEGIKQGYPILLTRETYQFFLTYKSHVFDSLGKEDATEQQDLQDCQELLSKLGTQIEKGIEIVDEHDALWDPTHSFKRSRGATTAISNDQTAFFLDFSQVKVKALEALALSEEDVTLRLAPNGEILTFDLIGDDKETNSEKLRQSIADIYIQRFITTFLPKSDHPETSDSIHHRHVLKAFLLEQISVDQIKTLKTLLNTAQGPDAIGFIKQAKKHLELMGLNLVFGRDYGYLLNDMGVPDIDRKPVAVPYAHAFKPYGPDTHFNDKTAEMTVTYESLMHTGITDTLFNDYLSNCITQLGPPSGILNSNSVVFEKVAQWLPQTYSDEQETLTFFNKDASGITPHKNAIYKLLQRLSQDSDFRTTFINKSELAFNLHLLDQVYNLIITPQITQQEKSVQSYPYDLQQANSAAKPRVILAGSGTRQAEGSWPTLQKTENKNAAALIAGIMGIPTHPVVQEIDTTTGIDALITTLADGQQDEAIIDVGGFLTISIHEVAKKLIAQNPHIKYIHYFDNGAPSTHENIGATGTKTVVIYGHSDTVGRDRKNPDIPLSNVLLSDINTLEDLHQGVMRIRELKNYFEDYITNKTPFPHQIQLIIPTDMAKQVRTYYTLTSQADISIKHIEAWLLVQTSIHDANTLFYATKNRLHSLLCDAADTVIQHALKSSFSEETKKQAARARQEVAITHPAQEAIKPYDVMPADALTEIVTTYTTDYPNLMTATRYTQMMSVIKEATPKLPTPMTVTEKGLDMVHQTKMVNEKKTETKKETESARMEQTKQMSSKIVWDPRDVFQSGFFSERSDIWVERDTRTNCWEKDKQPPLRYSRNYKCILDGYRDCSDRNIPVLSPHYVLVKQRPNKKAQFLVLHEDEGVTLRQALRKRTETTPDTFFLINIQDPYFTEDWVTSPAQQTAVDAAIHDSDFVQTLVKIQLELGLPIISNTEISTRDYFPQNDTHPTPENVFRRMVTQQPSLKMIEKLENMIRYRSTHMNGKDVYTDSISEDIISAKKNELTLATGNQVN